MARNATTLGFAPKITTRQRLAMTPSLQQALSIMAMRVGDLRRFALDMAQENPFLDVQLPLPSLHNPGQPSMDDPGFDFDRISHEAQHPISLAAYITAQIGQEFFDPDERALALAMVEHLSPVGWLDGAAWPRMKTRGIPLDAFDQVLRRLQDLEPAGVFARDLAECLRLQLQDQGLYDAPAKAVLTHLDRVSDGAASLAQAAGLSDQETASVLARLRRCQPKPGADFIQDDGDIFHPDLTISMADGGYTVTVNQGMMPSFSLRQDEIRQDEIHQDDFADDAASQFLLAKAKEDVKMMARSMARRQDMLLDLGLKLIQHQSAYLTDGEAAINPLTMTRLADQMGVHKATISRLVADKLVDTPRGMVMLADFFCQGVEQPDGRVLASRRIIATIRAMIMAEDPKSPLSDQQIADRLNANGIIVARRTIAKYRLEAGFMGQHHRRA